MFLGRPGYKHAYINTSPGVYTHRFPHVKHSKQVAPMQAQATHTRIERHTNKHKDPEIKGNKAHLAPELFNKAGRI